jgi:hypothetical protein
MVREAVIGITTPIFIIQTFAIENKFILKAQKIII